MYYLKYYTDLFSHRFVGQLLKLLICCNEKLGAQIQKNVKELVGHEMSPALYPILFDQIKTIVEKFFDQQAQVGEMSTFSIYLLTANANYIECTTKKQ